MVDRLDEDHKNARRLAQGIARIPGLSIDPERIKTNILYFDITSKGLTADELVAKSDRKGIKFLRLGPSTFRMVTHYGIDSEDVDRALECLNEVMKGA
jgi:threonine aldolase